MGGCLEPQHLSSKPSIEDSEKLLVGAWRDEEGVTTFRADGTEISEFDTGRTESGRWTIEGHVLTIVMTASDGKPIDPIALHYDIVEITNSSFHLNQLGKSECEWRASRV